MNLIPVDEEKPKSSGLKLIPVDDEKSSGLKLVPVSQPVAKGPTAMDTLGKEPGLEPVGPNQLMFLPPASEMRHAASAAIISGVGTGTQAQRDIGKVLSYAPNLVPMTAGEAAGMEVGGMVAKKVIPMAANAFGKGLMETAGKMISPEAQIVGAGGAALENSGMKLINNGLGYITEEPIAEGIKKVGRVVREGVAPTETPAVASPEAQDIAGNIMSGNLRAINTKYIANTDAKQVINEIAPLIKDAADKQGRGIMPEMETQKLANELGLTSEDLAKTMPGDIANAEKMYAYRSILESSAIKVKDLSTQYMEEQDPVIKQKLLSELTSHLSDHMDIQGKVTGIAAEIGRALKQQQYFTPGKADASVIKAVLGDASNMIDEEQVKKLAQTMASIGDNPEAAAAIISKTFKPDFMDKALEFASAIKVGGPTTLFKVTAGQTLASLTRVAEKVGSPFWDFLATGAGAAKDRNIFFGEIPYEFYGYFKGLPKASTLALRELGKIFTGEQTAGIAAGEQVANRQAIGGALGKAIRYPYYLHSAVNTFFGNILGEGALNSYAYRRAAQEGLSGIDLIDRTAALAKDPSKAIMDDVNGVVKEFTFRNELGTFGKKLNAAKNGHWFTKLVIPFFQTPVNLAKFGVQRAMAPLTPRFWNEIGEGGEKQAEAMTRGLIGGITAASFFKFAMDGYITGAQSKNPAVRDAQSRPDSPLYRPPYSIRIPTKDGHTWVEYRSFEPYSTLLATASDAAQAVHDRKDLGTSGIAAKMSLSVSKNMLNQNYMSGLTDLLEALEDDTGSKAEKLMSSIASGAMIPAVVGQMARAMDPYIRKPNGLEDSLKSKIPGMSEEVTPKRNVFGEPYAREGAMLPIAVHKQQETSFLESWLNDLGMDDKIGFPSKHLTATGRSLSAEDYDKVLAFSGPVIKARLMAMSNDPSFNKQTYDDKVKAIKNVETESRALINAKFLAPTELRYLGLMPTQDFRPENEAALTKIITNKIYKRLPTDDMKRKLVEQAFPTQLKRGPSLIDKIAGELMNAAPQ